MSKIGFSPVKLISLDVSDKKGKRDENVKTQSNLFDRDHDSINRYGKDNNYKTVEYDKDHRRDNDKDYSDIQTDDLKDEEYEREQESEVTFDHLMRIIESNGFIIETSFYTESENGNKYHKFFKIRSRKLLELSLIEIPRSKYKIKVDFISLANLGITTIKIDDITDDDEDSGTDEYTITADITTVKDFDGNYGLKTSRNGKRYITQLERLKSCIKDTVYKLSILNNDKLYHITRDNSISVYCLKEKIEDETRLFISINLEDFYLNIVSADLEIHQLSVKIYECIIKIAEKKKLLLKSFFEKQDVILNYVNELEMKNNEYISIISDLSDDCLKLDKRRRMLEKKGTGEGWFDTEIKEIKKLQSQIQESFVTIKGKSDRLMIKIDNLLYNGTFCIKEIVDEIK